MTVRVLVVDDHESWRRYVSSALRKNLQCQVVGEVADGLEAVQTAEGLKPDLIVLDVGLPTLNGIEVARRILARAPDSKILFFSEHRSRDIAEAALDTGAYGYVLKSDAGSDLLPAIEAVIEGKRFIGARFTGQMLERAKYERAPEKTRCHEIAFYADEASLLDGFARFAEGALRAGRTFIIITTGSRRHRLHLRLEACGLNIDAATEKGRYVSLDADETLSTFMVDGWLDEARFWKATTPLMVAAARASTSRAPRIAACGECAPLLLRQGHAAAAIQLEYLWDELASMYDMDILCGYASEAPHHDAENRIVERIVAAHSAVHPR